MTTAVAAASSTLRGADPCPFIVAEPPNGPRFPNGYIPTRHPANGAPPARGNVVESRAALGCIVARRWWDPTLRVERLDPGRVARLVATTEPIALPYPPEAGIGWGPGLTPAGDDVVVGMLIALRAAGSTVVADELAAACATQETTPLSRALLDHAARGEAVRPLLDLLRALAGRGDVDRAIAALQKFGASSGLHLIEGVRRALAR